MDPAQDIAISRRIIFIPLFLIILLLLICFIFLDIYFSSNQKKTYEGHLIRLARSGAQMIEFLPSREDVETFDRLADTFAKDSRFRVTLLQENGMVIGDSRLSPEEIRQMENQSDRPEIRQASDSGTGKAIRFSETLNIDLLLAAVHYSHKGYKGYFRVALPLDELKRERFHQRFLFAGFFLIALIISAGFSLMASRHLLSIVTRAQAYLEKRVAQRTSQIESLQSIITQLTVCHTLEEVLEVIRLGVSHLLPDHSGALALFRSSKDKLEIRASWNGEWSGDKSYSPNQCWALRTGQPYEGSPVQGNIACDHSRFGRESMLCIPVVAQGVIHGVFHFSNAKDRSWFKEERQLATAIAEHVSLTISSLDLRESLRQQAILDPLTGLYNRRYLMEMLTHEIGRASRREQGLGLLMMDIDHFKKFNDDHGHDIGDFILSEFGILLRKLIRAEDIPCRYGGEEFTILLPETSVKGVLHVAEKIRTTVREHDFLFRNHFYGPITISIGGAMYPDNAKAVDRLLKEADNALYEAKNTGRDKVVLSSKTV